MTRILLPLLLLLLGKPAQAGTIRGNLINGTTGGTASASSVRLLDMGAGMDQIGTLLDVEGRFQFEDVPSRAGAPYLLQVQSGGVLYSQPVNLPGDEVAVDFEVFDSTDDPSPVNVSLYHVIFQRDHDQVTMMEFLEFTNNSSPPVAVWRDGGPITVELPVAVEGEAQVQVSTTSGMPLQQELLPTDEDHIFTIGQALKPGVTRVVIQSVADYSDSTLQWSPTVHHPVALRSVLVSPDDVQVTGTGLAPSQEASPIPGYAVYEGGPLAAGEVFDVRLEGGSLQAADPHAGLDMGEHSPDDGHDHSRSQVQDVQVRENRLTGMRPWIMGGLGVVLLLGLASSLQRPAGAVDAQRSHTRQLARLEDRFLAGELDRQGFEAERDRLQGTHTPS